MQITEIECRIKDRIIPERMLFILNSVERKETIPYMITATKTVAINDSKSEFVELNKDVKTIELITVIPSILTSIILRYL